MHAFFISILILLLMLWQSGCNSSPPPAPQKPITPVQSKAPSLKENTITYSGTMSISDSSLYAQFLENARFACSNRACIGFCDCDQWLGEASIELVFNKQLTQLKSFTLIPQGSGSWYVGNRNLQGQGIHLNPSSPVRAANEDEGWIVSMGINNVTRLILYCENCDLKKGDLEDLRAFRGSLDHEIGDISVSEGSLNKNQPAPAHPYPYYGY